MTAITNPCQEISIKEGFFRYFETLMRLVQNQSLTYVAVGSNKSDRISMENCHVAGYYLAQHGFTLKTMGKTKLEQAFVGGCDEAKGHKIIVSPDDEYNPIFREQFEDEISKYIGAEKWKRYYEKNQRWITALFIMTIDELPAFVLRGAKAGPQGFMVDRRATMELAILEQKDFSRFLYSATGMSEL